MTREFSGVIPRAGGARVARLRDLIACGCVLVLVLAACGGDDDGSSSSTSSVPTQDARAEVDATLLGDAWTGHGAYSIVKACKAAGDGFSVYAARITAPGLEDGQTLFWRVGGDSVRAGDITGDTLTRQFSQWGSATAVGSSADEQVNDARDSDAGKAVIACAES